MKIVGVVLLVLLLANVMFLLFFKSKSVPNNQLISFNVMELKKYDGTDPNLPIYLAYNGDVYDVTAGKEFYVLGGAYHDLAGKDSTKELNFAGGGIIKIKYKIIGKLI